MALTSRVFAAVLAVKDDIDGLTLPPHATGAEVETRLAIISRDQPGEYVMVVPSVGDDATIEFVTTCGRDEAFDIRVVIQSIVPGSTDTAVVERLAELADAVQVLYGYQDDGTYLMPDFEGSSPARRGWTRVQFVVWPDDEGFAGQAELVLGVTARI